MKSNIQKTFCFPDLSPPLMGHRTHYPLPICRICLLPQERRGVITREQPLTKSLRALTSSRGSLNGNPRRRQTSNLSIYVHRSGLMETKEKLTLRRDDTGGLNMMIVAVNVSFHICSPFTLLILLPVSTCSVCFQPNVAKCTTRVLINSRIQQQLHMIES